MEENINIKDKLYKTMIKVNTTYLACGTKRIPLLWFETLYKI